MLGAVITAFTTCGLTRQTRLIRPRLIISGPGYEGAKYDASIVDENNRQAFADECARGCSAKNTGYVDMYIFSRLSNNYNAAAGSFQ